MGSIIQRIPVAGATNATITPDGRYILFEAPDTNQIAGDTNGVSDIFRYDTETGQVIRVTVADGGSQPNGGSFNATISPDGRYVLFESAATNLLPFPTNGQKHVYMRDMSSGITILMSVNDGGIHGDSSSYNASSTPNSRFVVFTSDASNLVAGDTNNAADVFFRDTAAGETLRISLADGGGQADGPSGPQASISADARYVVFSSQAGNLTADGETVSPESPHNDQIFLRDRHTGQTVLISESIDGDSGGDGKSTNPVISADGRYVLFTSTANDLVTGDTNGAMDVFLKDMQTGATIRVSEGLGGVEANGASGSYATMSADGRYVTFASDASNLVAGDGNGFQDFFVKDMQTGAVTRISAPAGGGDANGSSGSSTTSGMNVSADGRMFVFNSDASNLVAGDTNDLPDLFFVTLTEDPVIATSGGTTSAREQVAAVIDRNLALEDTDSTTLTRATVSITGNFVRGQDVLQFANTSAINGSYNATTGVLTLTAVGGTASVAAFEAALQSVKYLNTSNAPSFNTRTISFKAHDGVAEGIASPKTVSVAKVNDTPTDIVLAGASVKEFRAAGTVVGQLSTVDPDGAGAFKYALLDNAGGRFKIVGNKLQVANSILLDHEQATSHQVRIKVTDNGGLTRIETFTIKVLNVTPEIITGDSAANRIFGGTGNDRLSGMSGNDILVGGRGKDTLTGGLHNDTFKFVSVLDSSANHALADVITDFEAAGRGNDTIDLSGIYGAKLAYIGTAAFTKVGQVRINDIAGPDLMVEVNTGGSLAADFAIRLKATTLASMTAGDFVL